MRIAVTDTMVSKDKFNFYVDWLMKGNSAVEVVKLSYIYDNLDELNRCQGVLLSGGNDVDPSLYNGPANHQRIKDVDPKRDDFERRVIDKTLARHMPLLAICRGMQFINVHLGGTLFPDIEEAGYRSHRTVGEIENHHSIAIDQSSLLYATTGVIGGTVNSHHHQGVDVPGAGLRITARADDGIVEAMELDGELPFGILLQWHPERMKDSDNPLTTEIRNKFLLTIQYS